MFISPHFIQVVQQQQQQQQQHQQQQQKQHKSSFIPGKALIYFRFQIGPIQPKLLELVTNKALSQKSQT